MRSHFSAGGLLLAACLLFSFSAFAAPNENVVHPNTVLASLRSYPPQINNGGGGSGTVTSVSGTTNQIDVATGTTTPVISIDPVLQLPGSLAVSDFTVGVTAHTLVAGASGLVDLSSEAAGGLKVPVVAGCTAAANGNICDDTTRGNFHVRAAGGVDSIVLVSTTLPGTVAALLKSNNTTTALISAASIVDDGSDITSTEIASLGNRVALTSDFTDSTSATLQLVSVGAGNELKWTLPTNKALNVSFHCVLLFDQATAAVSDSFGIGVTGTAPTQANASGVVWSNASGAWTTTGVLTALASTTPTAVATFTPSAITTVWRAELDGTVEQPSNATPGVFGIYVSTTTGTDNIIVKRGSYCSLF